ncbi:uncharacterized protein RCO7_01325 [Rhynchosporium graminicola]|uniref:Luciferase domain-containing protein n=1 Tax=Rhynchosporium graminicola TaxID=2792576 RepID=A0A1E1K2Z5_9HELO|nr:uncharacterized protein RCO7_01325 [Rhynchosporium commune]
MTTTTTTQLLVQEPDYVENLKAMAQHDILRVTLNGPTLFLTIIAMILAIQNLQPSLTCTLLALAPLPWIVYNDYVNFLNLGPGGTPSTFKGYLKITCLRLCALSDPYKPADKLEDIRPTLGYHNRAQSWLPKRSGPRPKIAGIAPQRQLDQLGCAEMNRILRISLENFAIKHPDVTEKGESCFEKKGLALFARNPINVTCRGEICHVHDSDRSMHLNLHPDDAKVVIEQGWGERHPLSRGGWMTAFVPREFTMIYAPRDRAELDVICQIIEAAGFWVCGERFKLAAESQPLMEIDAKAGVGDQCA